MLRPSGSLSSVSLASAEELNLYDSGNERVYALALMSRRLMTAVEEKEKEEIAETHSPQLIHAGS